MLAAAWLVSQIITLGRRLTAHGYFHTEYTVASTEGLVRVGVAWENKHRIEDAPSLFVSMSGFTRETGNALALLGLAPDFLRSLVPAFLRWTEPRRGRTPIWAQRQVQAIPAPASEALTGMQIPG